MRSATRQAGEAAAVLILAAGLLNPSLSAQGRGGGAPYFNGEPVTMPMAEMFKIENGTIRDIEAIGIRLPYGMGSGWE